MAVSEHLLGTVRLVLLVQRHHKRVPVLEQGHDGEDRFNAAEQTPVDQRFPDARVHRQRGQLSPKRSQLLRLRVERPSAVQHVQRVGERPGRGPACFPISTAFRIPNSHF